MIQFKFSLIVKITINLFLIFKLNIIPINKHPLLLTSKQNSKLNKKI